MRVEILIALCVLHDPLPNLDTCSCGTGGLNDTLNACHTKHGVTCVLNTVVNCTTLKIVIYFNNNI